MKKQTIGVEAELNCITIEKAAKVAAKFFGTSRYENTAGRNGYYTLPVWDGQGRGWRFQRDVSIACPIRFCGAMLMPRSSETARVRSSHCIR